MLVTEADFHDLTRAYLERAHRDNVRHAELFFDPQMHAARGVDFATVITGIRRGLEGDAASTASARTSSCASSVT